jgi:hypothetical protein
LGPPTDTGRGSDKLIPKVQLIIKSNETVSSADKSRLRPEPRNHSKDHNEDPQPCSREFAFRQRLAVGPQEKNRHRKGDQRNREQQVQSVDPPTGVDLPGNRRSSAAPETLFP